MSVRNPISSLVHWTLNPHCTCGLWKALCCCADLNKLWSWPTGPLKSSICVRKLEPRPQGTTDQKGSGERVWYGREHPSQYTPLWMLYTVEEIQSNSSVQLCSIPLFLAIGMGIFTLCSCRVEAFHFLFYLYFIYISFLFLEGTTEKCLPGKLGRYFWLEFSTIKDS